MRFARSAVVLLGLTGLAGAEEPSAELERELQAGVAAFRLGKLEEARMHLQKANLLGPKLAGPHRFLAAVAQAEKRWDECIDKARAALALDLDPQAAADTRKLHHDCRSAAGRAQYPGELGASAAVHITSNVQAQVKIRGLPFGVTPITPRLVTPGRLAIDIEKVGYRTASIDIDALPGIVTDVMVELQQGESTLTQGPIRPPAGVLVIAPGDPSRRVEIDGVPVTLEDNKIELAPGVHVVEVRSKGSDPWRRRVAITMEGTATLTPELHPSGPRERKRTFGRGLVGGGVAFIGVGVATFFASRSAGDDAREILRSEVARPPGDQTTPIRTREDFEDARTRANAWGLVSNLTWGLGLALTGGGIYMVYKHRTPSGDAPGFALAPVSGGAIVTKSVTW